MKYKQLIYGIATFVPGVHQLRTKGTGGTISPRYCYSVWLRHLIMAKKSGFDSYPKTVAELGPGDSIGIGLAALISGCEKYVAFDIVEHTNLERNLSIFNELVNLFKNKTPIPGNDELPKAKPRLTDYGFPSDIFDDDRIHDALEDSRIEKIRNSIRNIDKANSMIEYKVPWYEANVLESESIDMIYSQAVLEHVDDLRNTYNAMYAWLRPTGHMSHTIDFTCHQTADEWNGHWGYSDFTWKLIRGKRPYLLNREPYSTHIKLINNSGFKFSTEIKTRSKSNLTLKQLAARFRSISQEDLVTSGVFIQAAKKPPRDA